MILLQVGEKIAYAICLFSLVFVIKWIIIVPVSMAVSTSLVVASGWLLFLGQAERRLVLKLDRGFIREIITQGWPVGVAGASLRVNTNADSIFVNAYHGDLQTGLYGAAYRLINAIITAGQFFTNAVFPLSCKRFKELVPALADFIGYSTKLLLMVMVPGVVLLSVMSEVIIVLIFGYGYAGAVQPFRLLVWAAGLAIICRLSQHLSSLRTSEKLYENYPVICRLQSNLQFPADFALWNDGGGRGHSADGEAHCMEKI